MIEQQRTGVEPDDRITLSTRFGEFECASGNLVQFPQGLPGFERCHRFALLASADGAPLQILHAVEGTPASFLVLDPRLVLEGYRCVLSACDRERLQASESDPLVWLALLAIDEAGNAAANLRAPVVINPKTMTGFQMMPQDTLYPLRQPVEI